MTEKLDALKLVPYSEVGCFDEKDVVKAGIIVGCVKRDVLRVEYMNLHGGAAGLRRLYVVLVVLEMKGDYWAS